MSEQPRRSLIRRIFSAALVCLLAVAMLGASDGNPDARFGRLGHNLMCVCGCGQVLIECNHVGCPDSARMLNELHDQVSGPNSAGADSLLLNWFVAKYGATVLAAPIRGGFDIVAWVIPFTLFVLGTFGTAMLVRLWAHRRASLPLATGHATQTLSPDMLARIRRDTDWDGSAHR